MSVLEVFKALGETGRPTAAHLITGAAKGGVGAGAGKSCAALRVVAWWEVVSAFGCALGL